MVRKVRPLATTMSEITPVQFGRLTSAKTAGTMQLQEQTE